MTTRREKSKMQKPQMNKQLEAIWEDQVPKNNQSIALEAGKFCLDIAKLELTGGQTPCEVHMRMALAI